MTTFIWVTEAGIISEVLSDSTILRFCDPSVILRGLYFGSEVTEK